MPTFTEMVQRVRNTLSVQSSYDTELESVVKGVCERLLRDYNFPKQLSIQKYMGVLAGTDEFELPAGFKKPLAVRIHAVQDLQNIFGDALIRRDGFMLPSADGSPTHYWLMGNNLVLNTPLPVDGYNVWLWMQSKDFDSNHEWLLDEFPDAVFYLSCLRAAPIMRKDEVLKLFAPLWADEQSSLAIYLNELDYQDLQVNMREARVGYNACYSGAGDTVIGGIGSGFIRKEMLYPLLGVSQDAQHFGIFTGSTIPDASDAKEALQALETKLEDPARSYVNTTMPGGLFGLDDGISRTAGLETYSFSGSRAGKAQIGRTIILDDASVGPISGPAEASYGLSIYGQRPNWNTSSITGEMDGLNITLRQANGDSCAILSNVFGRVGFFGFLECEVGSMDAAGEKIKAINAQLAIVNSREGGEYGLVVQAKVGTNLSAGVRVTAIPGSSWRRYAEYIDADGQYVFAVDGPTGVTQTKTLIPFSRYAGNVGAPSFEYDGVYARSLRLTPGNFAALPDPTTCAGMISRIADAVAPFSSSNQIVSAGGGGNPMLLTSNGTNWVAISS